MMAFDYKELHWDYVQELELENGLVFHLHVQVSLYEIVKYYKN